MKSKRYDVEKASIVSGFREQIEAALQSALKVFDDSKAESIFRECCFIGYDKEKPSRFIHRDSIGGKHVIIILDDLLEAAWEKEKDIVRILFDELSHYELGQKNGEANEKDRKKAHKLAESWFEEWLRIEKEEKGL